MKTILISLILALGGCTSSDDPDSTLGGEGTFKKPGIENEGGGISSGGGDTLPSNPIGMYNARHIVMKAKKDLRLLLNYMSWVYSPGIYSGEDKVFGGTTTILDLLETVDIEILQDKPCKDSGGNDVDASIYSSKSNAICISAFAIGPKLIKERARKEILALLVHEISHLLGTDEPEAVKLQRSCLTAFDMTVDTTSKDMLDKATFHLDDIIGLFGSLIASFEKQNNDEVVGFQELIQVAWLDFSRVFHQMPYSIFKRKDMDFYRIHERRADLALQYSFGESSESNAQMWKDRYSKIFGGKNSIEYSEYYEDDMAMKYKGAYGDHLLKKIESRDDLKKEFVAIRSYLKEVSSHIFRIQINSALYPLVNPVIEKQQNPWEHFVGKYEVVGTVCEENGVPVEVKGFKNMETFELYFDEKGLFKMREGYSGGNTLFMNPIYRGSYNNIGGYVYVSGNSEFATGVAQINSLWDKTWGRQTLNVKKTTDGFEFLKKTERQERDWYNGVERSSNSCTYKMNVL